MIVGLAWRTANGGWWRREDGSIATTQLGTLDRGACRSAEDLDLQVADAKPILGRLQEIVVSEQLQRRNEKVGVAGSSAIFALRVNILATKYNATLVPNSVDCS